MTGTRERDAADAAATLSPLARRLEARAGLAGALPRDAGEVAVRFAPWHLDADDRRRWRATTELALVAPGGTRTHELPERATDELWTLVGPRAELALLAQGSEAWTAVSAAWTHACAPLAPPELMGVVNVTPDSFSDGGRYLAPERAVEHGRALAAEGAAILDVGGESTRPGSEDVPEAEELRRVLPVIEGLATATPAELSIDTQKAAVARAALDAGASMVNDVSAGRLEPELVRLAAERGARLCLMHMQGRPRTMQAAPRYADVVREVTAFLRERAAAAWSAGVALPRIVVDPGIGFGKRLEDNLALIRATSELRSLGFPVLLGVSRKSFLSALTGTPHRAEKVPETSAAVTAGVLFGAEILRVHDVRRMRPLVRVAAALAGAPLPPIPSA